MKRPIDIRVQEFAIKQHDQVVNQKYGNRPYSYHLTKVAEVLDRFKRLFPEDVFPLIKAGAWGHDLIEDARLTYNDVKERFGEEVAELIYACTEDKGRTRAERHSPRYFQGIVAVKWATAIKLADTIANIEASIVDESRMLNRYTSEYEFFKEHIYAGVLRDGLQPMFQHYESLVVPQMDMA